MEKKIFLLKNITSSRNPRLFSSSSGWLKKEKKKCSLSKSFLYRRETLIAGRGARINQDFTVVRMVVTTDDIKVLPVDKISRDSGMVGTRNSDSMSCDHQRTRWKKPAFLVTLALPP